jgi:hypothetical protein
MSERQPVHPSRHFYVCEDEFDFFMKLERADCCCGVVGLIYRKPSPSRKDAVSILTRRSSSTMRTGTLWLLVWPIALQRAGEAIVSSLFTNELAIQRAPIRAAAPELDRPVGSLPGVV